MFLQIGEGNEFHCPYCKQGLDIYEWDTEYGDPLPGDHDVKCVKCGKEFRIDVEVRTVITVRQPPAWKMGTNMNDNGLDALVKTARILDDTDGGNDNPDLQAIVGDPDDYRLSTFAQFKPNPGSMQIPNPLSPILGDEIFFCYCIPGAKFQAHDGSQWLIEDYPWQNVMQISNVWYPRINAQVSLYDVRRSIEQWIEPIQQFVPPPPPGVDYAAMRVKVVDGSGTYGAGDELSTGSTSSVSGGW